MQSHITKDNRIDIKEWQFSNDPYSAIKKIDRYFYQNYSSRLLKEVERIRESGELKGKGFIKRFQKRMSGSQFILEYEGVKGFNKMGGHRKRMTDRINKVYWKITKEFPPNDETEQQRHLINTKILETPFGGLEVATQIISLIQSYQALAQQHQTEQLAKTYDNEVWKWITLSHPLLQIG